MNEIKACLTAIETALLKVNIKSLEEVIHLLQEKQEQLRIVAIHAREERVPHINSNLELLETLLFELNNMLNNKIKYQKSRPYSDDL